MSKTAMIRARMDETLNESVEKIFKKLALSTTEAITLYYSQIKLNNGIPFRIKIPNKTTEKTFKETDKEINLNKVNNTDDLFRELRI